MKGSQAVGLYGIGYSLFMVTAIISKSFASSLYPLFSRYCHHARDKAISLYRISFRLLFVAAVLVMVTVLALADKVVIFLFKDAYSDIERTPHKNLVVFEPFSYALLKERKPEENVIYFVECLQ